VRLGSFSRKQKILSEPCSPPHCRLEIAFPRQHRVRFFRKPDRPSEDRLSHAGDAAASIEILRTPPVVLTGCGELEDGVSFNGKHCRSLSEAAREITGCRWSGPRFFALRCKLWRTTMEQRETPIRRCAI